MGKKYFVNLLLLLLLISGSSHGQNTIGIPNIISYTKQDYGAGNQNWSIVQDKNGILYFANNQGLLTFDGTFWRVYPLPNKTMVRSVALGPDNRIYVGGQSEFGYFTPGAEGELTYTSLMPLVPESEKEFTDVWNICLYGNKVFFRSYKKILEYSHKKVIVHNNVHWNFMAGFDTGLLAFEFERGLVRYTAGKWVPAYRSGTVPAGIQFRATVNLGNDSILLVSLLHGLYILRHDTIRPFSTPDLQSLARQNVYGVTLLSPDHIALITNLGGCVIIDRQGRFVQRFTKKEGIQTNNVLSVFLDRDKNLWLGLDNGIDLITYSNSIKNIFPDPDDRNSGYASVIYKNRLYLGVSNGAYKIDLKGEQDLSFTKGTFEPVHNSKGQVWGFSVVNDQLFMGHNSGAYLLRDNTAIPVDEKTGFWEFQPLSKETPAPMIMAGTYNGINFYHYAKGAIYNPNLNTRFESARYVVRHGNIIWIAHPIKGLYTVRFDDAGKPQAAVYADRQGILSDNHNKISKVAGKLLLTSDKGVFEYRDDKGDFVPAPGWLKLFGGVPPSHVKEDRYGNIWFCRDRKVGVIEYARGSTTPVFIPELNDRIMADGAEHITVIDSNNVLIAADKGFIHLNYAQYKKSRYPLQVLIRKVRSPLQEEGLIYGGCNRLMSARSIAHKFNSLHFEWSSTLYGQKHNTEYSFYLEGFDKEWSKWQQKTEKDYTNLPAGDYVFQVKCRNNFNNESGVSRFSFTILPPWYQTWWAYGFYLLVFSGTLYLVLKRQQQRYRMLQQAKLQEQRRQYDEEQKRLQILHQLEMGENEKQIMQLKHEKLLAEMEQKKLKEERELLDFKHQLEVEKAEKEIINLRNEKLQAEVEHKNSELASSAMNLVRKMEILSRLKEDLIQFREKAAIEKGVREKEFLKIIKVLDQELDPALEWEQFARHFDSVHANYLKKLKEFCPDLSPTELKLAAYLRLNLSSKEIAQLMTISIRGVETSRYRLRKKLGLKAEDHLFDFLLRIGS